MESWKSPGRIETSKAFEAPLNGSEQVRAVEFAGACRSLQELAGSAWFHFEIFTGVHCVSLLNRLKPFNFTVVI